MFNSEFYPTPLHVLEQMDIDCYGKICADFSDGKGDIVDYLKSNGAARVLAAEINDDLCKILAPKCELIGRDFFKIGPAQISHVHSIIINPPFSCAEKHIVHAWNVAPEGCEITALCNWETIKNDYSYSRSELKSLINNYGNSSCIGNCFSTAERKTNAEIGLVKLFKPAFSSGFDFDAFYFMDDEVPNKEGMLPYNEIRAVVNSYVASVKCFDKCKNAMAEMAAYTSVFGFSQSLSFNVNYNEHVTTKEMFSREMQIKCWQFIFSKMNMKKYVTKGVMEDINKFVNSRLNYPFSMKNVYRMLEIIVGTRDQTMNRAIVEAVDNFTKHTKENRFGFEGWKTNAGHLLNKKFITGWMSECNYSGGLRIRDYNCSNYDSLVDLTKALCYITGVNYDTIPSINSTSNNTNPNFKPNTWYSWGFFDFKIFKKGTGHFKFKEQKVWESLNRAYAKIKGEVLPEKI